VVVVVVVLSSPEVSDLCVGECARVFEF